MRKIEYLVKDMHCAMCKKAIEKALSRLSGVVGVMIDLDRQTVTIDTGEGADEEKLERMITYLGYTPERIES